MKKNRRGFLFLCFLPFLILMGGCATRGRAGAPPEDTGLPVKPSVEDESASLPRISILNWSGGARAAGSLTFDDGTLDHYETVFPLLEFYGFKGTFFLTTGYRDAGLWMDGSVPRRLLSWDQAREMARAGHEMGAHGLWHKNMAEGLDEHERYALFTDEFLHAGRRLEMETGYPVTTFAWPYFRSAEPAKQEALKQFIAARQGSASAEKIAALPDSYFISPHDPGTITSLAILPKQTDEEWIFLAERIQTAGGWLVLCFHGIDSGTAFGETLGWAPIPERRLDSILGYLKDKSVWVAPFGTIYQYIRQRDSARITVTEYSASTLSFMVTVDLEDQVPLIPLTVEIIKPHNWTGHTEYTSGDVKILEETRERILLEVTPERPTVQNPSIMAQWVTLKTRY